LNVNVQCAENSFFGKEDVWQNAQGLLVNGDANPMLHLVLEISLVRLLGAPQLFKIGDEAGLQLLHVEFKRGGLGEVVQLLNKKRGVVFIRGDH